jgi:hypothetical protein
MSDLANSRTFMPSLAWAGVAAPPWLKNQLPARVWIHKSKSITSGPETKSHDSHLAVSYHCHVLDSSKSSGRVHKPVDSHCLMKHNSWLFFQIFKICPQFLENQCNYMIFLPHHAIFQFILLVSVVDLDRTVFLGTPCRNLCVNPYKLFAAHSTWWLPCTGLNMLVRQFI